MPPPEDELARIAERLDEIERRLARLEARLNVATAAPHRTLLQRFRSPAGRRNGTSHEPQATSHEPFFETRLGLTWINRIGVITLVIGVAFFFKYAVDNRWIGGAGRVALGIAAGLALLAAGDRLWRRDQGAFAQGITAAGIAILYVSFYAAFALYHLVPQPLAFALMVLNTAAGATLALRYAAPAIAALALAGGYITPAVLSTGRDYPWAFFGYVLALSAGAILLARAREWRVLEYFALAGAAWLYFLWAGQHFRPEKRLVATAALLALLALFAIARSRSVVAGAFGIALVELLVVSAPRAYPYMAVAPLVCAAAIWLGLERRSELRMVAFGVFWTTYGIGHFTFKEHAAAEAIFAWVTLAFAVFTAAHLHARLRRDLVLGTLNAAFYFTAAYDLLALGYRPWLGLFAVALAAAHFALARWLWAERHEPRAALLYLGIALAFATLAAPIQFSGYRITMAWALEGAALAWIGARSAERRLFWAASAVFGLALFRVVALDAWVYGDARAYGAVFNLRFLTFVVAVAGLWMGARWMMGWGGELAVYIAGHFVLLFGLVLEVFGWAQRTAAPAEAANLASTAASIALALYAVVLVAIGVAARSAINRILGLALIALVVVKLYVYDVWRVTRGLYRVAAFAALGILLLAMSYLYSRYRTTIESWWKDEETRP